MSAQSNAQSRRAQSNGGGGAQPAQEEASWVNCDGSLGFTEGFVESSAERLPVTILAIKVKINTD